MKKVHFHSLLVEWINNRKLSRRDFIAKLQMYDYRNFSGLDAITLSRWLNGKTTPSMYKQMIIAKCLDVDIIDFVLNVDSKKLKYSNKISDLVANFVKLLDYVNPILSYHKLEINTKIYVENVDFNNHYGELGHFYENVDSLRKFTQDLYSLNNAISYTTLRLLNSDNSLIGHWIGIEPMENLIGLSSFAKLSKKELEEGYLIHIGFFRNSRDLFDSISFACCYYIAQPRLKNKKYAYLLISGFSFYELAKHVFGAEDVRYYPTSDETASGVYLVKLDIVKAIVNPVILPSIQKKLGCVVTCDGSCKLCNLKEFLFPR